MHRTTVIALLASMGVARVGAQALPPFQALPPGRTLVRSAVPVDSQQARPRAVSYSDLYYTRLKIHRIGSYAMLPLFAGEYLMGNTLLTNIQDGVRSSQSLRSAHAAVAAGLGVLFGINTATGLWNLWDSRHESTGAGRKYMHAALMVAADAGLMWAASSADDANERSGGPRHHRNIALGAISAATIGSAVMWLWK